MTETPHSPGADAPGTDPESFQQLLDVLALEELGTGRQHISIPGVENRTEVTAFRGRSQRMPHGRVFGGQVLSQALLAAGLTVRSVAPERAVHSLHAYFMRPGDDKEPIRFAVELLRDGNSFSTRHVHALQDGRPILSMTASFQDPAGGLDHHDVMPQVTPPEAVPSVSQIYAGLEDDSRVEYLRSRPIEIRHVEGRTDFGTGEPGPAEQRVWMRAVGDLPDDPLVHAAAIAYASDYTLLEPVLRRHGVGWSDRRLRVASLDHAMWFHRPIRWDDWILYTQSSPSAQGGRGLAAGRMFSRDGTMLVTTAQEGMMRVKDLPASSD
ncbi:acyl-CoA thioesterase [Janibacter sp. G1551]|uniref:acyl-CoA thioesterase n=1 Tax=Janibacter sp. G1551 TaxID=3420440 RepID=UPI003CFE7B47